MKLLNLGIYSPEEPNLSLRKALLAASEFYKEYDVITNRTKLHDMIMKAPGTFDTIFMQTQQEGIIGVSKIAAVRSRGIRVFNFTGDVRQPLPRWYIDMAPHVTTLFTNLHDAEHLQALGYDAHYFPVGFNEENYLPDQPIDPTVPEIVFMGNNFNDAYPLGKLRGEMVDRLRQVYGSRFGLYGSGWPAWFVNENVNYRQMREAQIYKSTKIAINLSHFNLKRYSSDRLMRIMASGAFCLTHNYIELEAEFQPGVDLDCFDSIEELIRKIDFYLNNDELRNKIARTGSQKVIENYNWTKRIEQLKSLL